MSYYTDNVEKIHREVKRTLSYRLGVDDDATSTEITSIIGDHLEKQEDYILNKIWENLNK